MGLLKKYFHDQRSRSVKNVLSLKSCIDEKIRFIYSICSISAKLGVYFASLAIVVSRCSYYEKEPY